MNGMERIEQLFQQQQAFVGYLTVGDGGIQRTLAAALALIAGGVNILEIGVPFSDPIADGPVIQRAAARALAAGTTLNDVLELVATIRQHSAIPLILFSYLNPILAVQQSDFFERAKTAGVDGLLLVDCPLEEGQGLHEQCLQQKIAPIYVITPATTIARMQQLDQHGHGFLYYACRAGTTGMRADLPPAFVQDIQRVKATVRLPVITGFGIANVTAARTVLSHTDGVVIGSLFVKAIEDGIQVPELVTLVKNINPLG